MPDGGLASAYEALGRGESGPLLALLGPEFEWIEPEVPGYPLSGVHHGSEGLGGVLDRLQVMFEDLAIGADEVIERGDRVVAVGKLLGRPPGADSEWVLPFAHVWELEDGKPVRARAFLDRSRLTIAEQRRELAAVADDLLEQAAEIRRQWARLGDTLRAAGEEARQELDALSGEGGDDAPAARSIAAASARLEAVDMADDGATRDEVEAFLRDEHRIDDPGPILDEVFGAPGGGAAGPELGESPEAIEARRLSRLFARNRS